MLTYADVFSQVYYELVQARQKKKINNIAIVTLEQVRMLTYADVC